MENAKELFGVETSAFAVMLKRKVNLPFYNQEATMEVRVYKEVSLNNMTETVNVYAVYDKQRPTSTIRLKAVCFSKCAGNEPAKCLYPMMEWVGGLGIEECKSVYDAIAKEFDEIPNIATYDKLPFEYAFGRIVKYIKEDKTLSQNIEDDYIDIPTGSINSILKISDVGYNRLEFQKELKRLGLLITSKGRVYDYQKSSTERVLRIKKIYCADDVSSEEMQKAPEEKGNDSDVCIDDEETTDKL